MIERRKFLKTSMLGMGALAFAPNMGFGASTTPQSGLSGFPKRFIFIRKSNGMPPEDLALPSLPNNLMEKDKNKESFEVGLDKHDLPVWMRELTDYKDRLTILQGLSSKMSENGHSSYQSVMGLFKSNGGSISSIKRATIDFELAKLFPSPFGHVELSFANNRQGIVSGYSAPGPNQTNFCYADPITAYNNLFRCVLNPSAMDSDNDMFEYLQGGEKAKVQGLTGSDKNSFKNHISAIEGVRARNEKLAKVSTTIARHMPDAEKIQAYGKMAASTPQKQEAMTDVLVAAMITGLANVITYTIDDLRTSISGLPGNEKDMINIHGIGHHQSYSGVTAREIRDKMNVLYMQQVKTIADRLKAQPEGNGTMFDNTMIMYFPEGGEAHHGMGTEAPLLILSGKNCNVDLAGRYIRLPYWATEGHQTLGNWYTTLLNAHGNPIKHYGDLDAMIARKKLPQEGSIKQFLRA